MRWFLGYLSALCVVVLLVCQAIAIPTFTQAFYSHEYDKNNTPAAIQVEKDELMRVTGHLLDYMRGHQDNLTVEAVVAGETREFFNPKEKAHMVDVRNLFDIGFRVRNITFWLLLFNVLLMVFLKYRVVFMLARCCREVTAGFLILALLLVIIIAVDFNRAFDTFHLLFFDNDLWQLNPATDLLVNIVPLGFFTDIAIFIGVLTAVFSGVVIAAATYFVRRLSARTRNPEL